MMNLFSKKSISIALVLSMLLSAASCTAKNTETETEATINNEETDETTNDVVTETIEETETTPETETEAEETVPNKDIPAPAVETLDKILSIEDYPTDLEDSARTLLAKVRDEITNEKIGIAYEFLGKRQISFLWPFSVLLESVSALYECDTADEDLKEYYTLLLDKFLPRYQSKKSGKYRAYSSTTSDGDRYYDDNEWIVIELVRAYRLLGNEDYLTYAKELAEYVYSGWVESSGGVRWIEGGDSCNTCSNGPAAVLSCMLYEETGDKYYYDWAVKIYEWTKERLLAPDGTYYDNIKIKGGSVDKAKYPYNTGTMIVSGVMLYRITGDESYLDEARKSAEGGANVFLRKVGSRCVVTNSHPWFNSWLLEGFIELFEADTEEKFTAEYINDFYTVLSEAVKRAGDGIYVGKSWVSKADSEVELIHQAGTIRALAQLARVIGKYAE